MRQLTYNAASPLFNVVKKLSFWTQAVLTILLKLPNPLELLSSPISNLHYNWVKRQAEAHHHSINDELISLLENCRDNTENSLELSSDDRFAAILNISRRCRTLP